MIINKAADQALGDSQPIDLMSIDELTQHAEEASIAAATFQGALAARLANQQEGAN